MSSLPPRDRGHVLRELGFTIRPDGDLLRGSASITPEMHVPGTDVLRSSILATWVDTMTGLLTARFIGPRVPVTLGLDVHLYRPPGGLASVRATAEVVKVGSEVVVASVDLVDETDAPVGTGTGLFMVARDPELRLPASADELVAAMAEAHGPLAAPLADRAGCQRREPGVAVLPRADDGLNASNTVNGGLIALLVEEAALSTQADATLSMMSLHYLRPVRVGPAVATASRHGPVAEVMVTDEGRESALAVAATTRLFER